MLLNSAPDERPISAVDLSAYTLARVKTWIGGYRSRPEEWTEPHNWYPVGVPDWQDKIVIGGYGKHRCRVTSSTEDVLSIHVLQQARLDITKYGSLIINGLFADPLGLICGSGLSNEGTVEIAGSLSLRNTSSGGVLNVGLISNRGRILADLTVTQDRSRWGHYVELGARIHSGA